MENANFKKAWELLGEDRCFLCGKSLAEHIQETGKRFDMYCSSEYRHFMESWNWEIGCRNCLPGIKEIENQVLE